MKILTKFLYVLLSIPLLDTNHIRFIIPYFSTPTPFTTNYISHAVESLCCHQQPKPSYRGFESSRNERLVHFSAYIIFCSVADTQPKIFNQISVTGVHKLRGPGRHADYYVRGRLKIVYVRYGTCYMSHFWGTKF